MPTVEIRVTVTEAEHRNMTEQKGERTWKEVIDDGLEQ